MGGINKIQFTSVGDLLAMNEQVIPTLATAIEQGVFTFDRFGRFVRAEGSILESALDALAEMAWEPEYPGHLPERSDELASEFLCRYGWAANAMPDFAAIAEGLNNVDPPRRIATSRESSKPIQIAAAIAKHYKMDLTLAGSNIQRMVEQIGGTISPTKAIEYRDEMIKILQDSSEKKTNK